MYNIYNHNIIMMIAIAFEIFYLHNPCECRGDVEM